MPTETVSKAAAQINTVKKLRFMGGPIFACWMGSHPARADAPRQAKGALRLRAPPMSGAHGRAFGGNGLSIGPGWHYLSCMSAYKSPAPCTVLVTRPREDADRLMAELVERGATVVAEPLMTIVPKPDAVLDLTGVQAVLLTSANGARALAGTTVRRELRVLAVGDHTARIARAAGFTAVESAGGDLEDLARIVAVRLNSKDGALLHVAGRDVAGDLASRLARDGFAVRRAVLYQAEAATALSAETRAAIAANRIDAVLLFSPRTAATFVSLFQDAGLAAQAGAVTLICLSPAVATAAAGLSWRAVVTAAAPTQSDLLAVFDRWRGGGEQSGSDDMAERATTGKPDHPGGAAYRGPVIDVTPEPDSPRPDSTVKPKATARGGRLVLTLSLLAVIVAVAAIATRPIWQDFIVSSTEPSTPGRLSSGQPSPEQANGNLAALRAQLAQALDGLAQSERRADALEARLGALDGEIAALKNAARQPAPDERVAGALARLAALEAEIKALPRGAGGLAADTADRLARLEAALKAVPSFDPAALAQLRALAERAGAEQAKLADRLAVLETNQSAAQDAPRRAAALTLAIGQLGQALRGSTPFQSEFDAAAALAGTDGAIARVLDPLRGAAGGGVATIDQLRQRFPVMVSAIKQVEARDGDDGLIGTALARLARLVTIRRIDGTGGIDGMLARAEKALADRDLVGAVAALADLPAPVMAVARPWLGAAEARLAAEQALARLTQLAAAALGTAKP